MFKLYKRLFNYAHEYVHFGILSIIFSVISVLFTILGYYYIARFVYVLLSENNFMVLKIISIKIAISLSISAILYIISGFMSHILAFRLETNFRKKGIVGLSNASFSFFESNDSGIVRKIIDDNAGKTHSIVAHLIPDNVKAILTPFFIIILAFSLNLRIGLSTLLLFIITTMLFSFMMGNKEFMVLYEKSQEKMSGESVEFIRGIKVMKIFGNSIKNSKNLYKSITDYADLAIKYTLSCKKPYCIYQFVFFCIVNILIIPIVLIFKDIHTLNLLASDLIILFFFSGTIFSAYMSIMWVFSYIFYAENALNNLEKIYNQMNENKVEFGDKTEFKNNNIEFINVNFSYGEKNILNDLSFKLKENRIYALVGASGGGKTTIAKLISGFYKLNSGTVKIGDIDIKEYSETALLNNISFVFQNTKLFKKSIYENVLIAKPKASKEEVLNALHLAGCDNILNRFKDRENTIIGSKGVYLSGGEKQRIAIARAILKDTKIVIFDEASASLDAINEFELQKAFKILMKNKTVIMIAHRLSSIKNVDEILVIENGAIIERGKHEELLNNKGKYSNYWNKYLKANDWRIN